MARSPRKRPVGRPRKPAADKRSKTIRVRVTPELHGRVEAAAAATESTVSDWGVEAFELSIARGSTR
jgi:predicted HicB family RNase H-like nuclease